MGILNKFFCLGLFFSCVFCGLYKSYGARTCSAHLKPQVNDKLIDEVLKLNPDLDVKEKSPEEVYIALKQEEAFWYKEDSPYIDFKKSISEKQKQRILENYKVNLDKSSSIKDFHLFYLNQIRFLYIRASKSIYEKILTSTIGSTLKPAYRDSFKVIINNFLGHDLSDVAMKAERFSELMIESPWIAFPWQKALEINQAWLAKEDQGHRSFQDFSAEMKEAYPKLKSEHLDVILKSLVSIERESKVCCRSGMGCTNCPLNRRFFLR